MLCLLLPAPAPAFDFNDVAQRARELAASPFKKGGNLPRELQNLTYDQFRDIRFRPEKAHWSGAHLNFELAFFHQGWFYQEPVKINEVSPSGVREIRFDPDAFDYGASRIDPRKMQGLGFAGFRVHYPINTQKYKDEVLVFLGASYFRGLGKGQVYGLSARGLAVDTGLPSGEEFPRFVEFWIERPSASARELTIYGLLDSRRATGAYRFVLKPGVETALDIQARLYLRDKVGKLAIAPLTSMFSFGTSQQRPGDDYRPEVHDSDGLSIRFQNGEWIWRPLTNPKRLLVTSFATIDPVGFGLMQRDRRFSSFEDLEARYELRPSAWVEPKGRWGAGRIELVQIPAPDETNDNIVAYWLPDNVPSPKEAIDFEYRLLWQRETEIRPTTSWVTQTRRGRGYVQKSDNSIGYIIDFDGPALRKLKPDAKVEAVVSVDANGQLLERIAHRNDVTGGWRVMLRLRRTDESKPVELRAHLRSENNVLSETWSHILPPN
ncbi:MAG TPA: glucan biosynthesis protein G [Burkholderiales bacterium]|nr:glucan biosynthesis protein G [Burkholderiales bacterium]